MTAPVAPVLLLWMLYCNRAGNRWVKLAAFAAGGGVAFGPLAWLFVNGPRQTIFNVLQYNLLYRQRSWDGALEHNISQWSAWIGSPQALMLGMLAIAGLLFVWKRSAWEIGQRREFYLCGWLALGLMAHISTAMPTFTRCVTCWLLPFLAALFWRAWVCTQWARRLAAPDRPFWPALIVCLITFLCLAKMVYEGRDDFSWSDEQKVADKVKEVTPPQARLLADEPTLLCNSSRTRAGHGVSGFGHKLDFPPAKAAELHVVPQAGTEPPRQGRNV